MSIAGALPALSLFAGALAGLTAAPDSWVLVCVPPVAWLVACGAWLCDRQRLALSALALGFAACGVLLAVDALGLALHPSARAGLDRAFGGFDIDELGPAGRHEPVPTRLRLVEDAAIRDGFVSLRAMVVAIRLADRWEPVEGGATISVGGTLAVDTVAEWRAGRTVEAPVTFRRPARYLNEGVPDFERERALDGVALLGSVKSGLLVAVVARGGMMSELAADVRAHVRRAADRWIAPHDPLAAAIAAAVLIGDRAGLPDDVRDRLQLAGTYHVIAISGGNIAILASGATMALLLVGIRGRYASRAAIVVLFGYVAIVAAGPSVWRATVMAILYFAARAADHRTDVRHAAAVTAAVMIALAPLDVRNAGFILTFGATFALLYGARQASILLPKAPLAAWLLAPLVASLAVEAVLLPVSAWLFSQVTVAGIVLNLAAVPLMGVVQMAALVVSAASTFPSMAAPAGHLVHLAARGLVESASLVEAAPWTAARVPPPGLLLIAVYYSSLAIGVAARRPAVRVAAGTGTLIAALVVWGAIDVSQFPKPPNRHGRLRLTMFDVGQGESNLLETPDGQRLLVDAGGVPFGGGIEIGARVLAPALWARGIRTLGTLVVTHGDPDHIGGAQDVLRDFRPRHLLMGVPVPGHAPTQDLVNVARSRGVRVEQRLAGDTLASRGIVIRVLHPPAPDWERRRVRNDDSVVLEVVYRDVAILLTGDIGADVEREILPQLTRARTRVLKVGHHGSRTSSSLELLEGWRPQVALISAGRGNTFGHPAPEVLQRLEAIGARVLRTDLDGQITLETDGTAVSLRTYSSPKPIPTPIPTP